MRQEAAVAAWVLLSLHCGGSDGGRVVFRPSEEAEFGAMDGPEEPPSDDPGSDPEGVGPLHAALVSVLPPVGWRAMSPSTSIGFAPRSDAMVKWTRQAMLVYGGRLADGSYSNELAGYYPESDNWIRFASSPLSPRSHAIAVWTGRKIYVFGGRNATYRHMSSGGVIVPYETQTAQWFTIRSAPHILKCDAQGVWSPATWELLLFGCTGTAASGYAASGMAYHTTQKVWRELPAPPITARIGANVVWTNGDLGTTRGRMVVFGGGDPITRAPFWDGADYDPINNTWQRINGDVPREEAPSHGGEPRIYAAAALSSGRYLEKASFWGGRPADGATAFSDGAEYSPRAIPGSRWSSIPSPDTALAEPHRRYVSAWFGADRMFIWGGERYVAQAERILLGNGAMWSPRQRSWSPLPDGGPSPRARASAVWTGDSAIAWGGYDRVGGQERMLSDGMLYRPPPREMVARRLSTGYAAACAFVDDSALECWGPTYAYEFAVRPYSVPQRPHVIRGIYARDRNDLSMGATFACAIVDRGSSVHCFGSSLFGALGVPSIGAMGPLTVTLPGPARQISAGGDHVCAALMSGEIWCWGNNQYGQLGNGSTSERAAPGKVAGIDSAIQVSSGGDHSCALLADGTARCWGSGLFGKLGDGAAEQRLTPVAVSGLTDLVEIDAGTSFTCARKRAGTVHCWGSNAFGGLGQGSINYGNNPTPLEVRELADAVQLSLGGWYACAVRQGGGAVCWGDNGSGQLGDGTRIQRTLPTPVIGLSDIAEISASPTQFSCARSNAGNVWCWGKNTEGQLGDGTNVDRFAPRPVVW